jgi:hypothetical protein
VVSTGADGESTGVPAPIGGGEVVGDVDDALAIWESVFGTSPMGTMSRRRATAAFAIEFMLMIHSPFVRSKQP